MSTKKPKLAEIAARIDQHLKRLESDKAFNVSDKYGQRFWHSGALASGNRVFCAYLRYQGDCSLTRDEAEQYLATLDAGFKGTHYEALRKDKEEPTRYAGGRRGGRNEAAVESGSAKQG